MAEGEGHASGERRVRPRPWWHPHAMTAVVLLVGLAATSTLAVAAAVVHDRNERRLLTQRVSEVTLVFSSAIPRLTSTLAFASELAESSDDDWDEVTEVLAPFVGDEPEQVFSSLTIWGADGTGPLVAMGRPQRTVDDEGDDLASFIAGARAPTMRVRSLLADARPALGYAFASPRPEHRYVVYAEADLPPDRAARPRSTDAFEQMDFALYLGTRRDPGQFVLASTPDLPLPGRVATQRIPFGDTYLLLAMTAQEDLGGSLMARLPWFIMGAGIATSVGFAAVAERLVRRREEAESLALENDRLYRDQRSVAETLQRSLLPQALPQLPELEITSRYEPGVHGIEIGGDWYDAIDLGTGRILLVVGDVSGRGVEAGSVMAAIRYAIRAHATQGDPPGAILHKIGSVLHVGRDRHFATVVCIEVGLEERSMRIANAGHPRPLLLEERGARFLDPPVGPPIGVDPDRRYEEVEVRVEAGATLVLFTDGLVERRGEGIDEGMERLRAVAEASSLRDPDLLLDHLLERLLDGEPNDDTALLAVRWKA